MMTTLGLAGLITGVVALILTPIIRGICISRSWLDHPDGHRKLHSNPIPRLGGVVIAISYLAGFASLASQSQEKAFEIAILLGPATGLILATGLIDDFRGLGPWTKVLAEIAAGFLAWAAGVRLTDEWWGAPLTILWMVAATNAFNLIDGVDGLATGVGLLAAATLAIAGVFNGDLILAGAAVPLTGALAGFLLYNFDPASIYLGDSGSLTTGFLLGCLGILWIRQSDSPMAMVAPMTLLALPFLEATLSILRRLLVMQPIASADRGHIHHRLLARGSRPRQVALMAYAGSLVAAAFALLVQSSLSQSWIFLVQAVFICLLWIVVRWLGYTEFRVAGRTLLGRPLRELLRHEIVLERMRGDLAKAESVEECWDRLCEASKHLGAGNVLMRLGDVDRSAQLKPTASLDTWETRIPLNERDYIAFGFVGSEASASLLPLVLALREAVGKLPAEPHTASVRRSGLVEQTFH